MGLFLEIFHVFFEIILFGTPIIINNKTILTLWLILLLFVQYIWNVSDTCFLTEWEARLGDKHQNETLLRKYCALFTIRQLQYLTGILGCFVILKIFFNMSN